MKKWSIFIIIMVISAVFLLGIYISKTSQARQLEQDILLMKVQLESIRIEQETTEYLLNLIDQYQTMLFDMREENDRLKEILNTIGIETFEVSAYAPLDPSAVEGMCFEGDPTVTASGKKVSIGETIAVDTSIIPFGAKVWIEGFGWRTAHDRGGMIKGNMIDIAVGTLDEAYQIGRQDRLVVYQR